jgi:hypothetical protein
MAAQFGSPQRDSPTILNSLSIYFSFCKGLRLSFPCKRESRTIENKSGFLLEFSPLQKRGRNEKGEDTGNVATTNAVILNLFQNLKKGDPKTSPG